MIQSCTIKIQTVILSSHCSSFWWRTKVQPSPNHHIIEIMHCASSLFFSRFKTGLKGLYIAFIEEIQHTATTGLRAVPEEDLQKCFQQCQDHWSKCVEWQYFEDDMVAFYTYNFYYKLCLRYGRFWCFHAYVSALRMPWMLLEYSILWTSNS